MGKKKKKKASKSIFMRVKNIVISDSGMVQFQKGGKMDISSYVEESVKDTVISRIEGLPNHEEINIDNPGEEYRIETSANCSSIIRTVDLLSNINETEPQTIVIPVTKKRGADLDENPIIDWLNTTSSFSSIYKKIKDEWDALNKGDKTTYTNVLFIPKIQILLGKNCKMRKKPLTVNLLIVALPSMKNAIPGIELIEPTAYTNRIINDTMEAVIKLGLKNIVLDPFCMSALQVDVHYTARYWHGYMERQRTIENVNVVTFSIDDDDLYIIFCRAKNID